MVRARANAAFASSTVVALLISASTSENFPVGSAFACAFCIRANSAARAAPEGTERDDQVIATPWFRYIDWTFFFSASELKGDPRSSAARSGRSVSSMRMRRRC